MQEFNQFLILHQPAKSNITLDLVYYLLISSSVRSIVNMKLHLITYDLYYLNYYKYTGILYLVKHFRKIFEKFLPPFLLQKPTKKADSAKISLLEDGWQPVRQCRGLCGDFEVRHKQWRLVSDNFGPWELYDMNKDKTETNNPATAILGASSQVLPAASEFSEGLKIRN